MSHRIDAVLRTSHRAFDKFWILISAAMVGALFLNSHAVAQNTEERSRHSLRPGVWALEFAVQPSLYGFYNAAGIAAKRHFTRNSALRIGLLAAINHSDADGVRKADRAFPYDTTLTTTDINRDSDRRDVSLSLHFVRFLSVGNRFGMFLEAGPTARWISEEYGDIEFYLAAGYRHAGDRDSWNYGLETYAGFEWFFTRRLSLAGRFGVSGLRTDTDETDTYEFYNPNDGYWDRRSDVLHSEGFNVQTTPALISLTAYFGLVGVGESDDERRASGTR